MSATERDRETAKRLLRKHPSDIREAFAEALAAERERARAPFLAMADREDEFGSHLVTTDEIRAAAQDEP